MSNTAVLQRGCVQSESPPSMYFQNGLTKAFLTPPGAFVVACLLGPPLLELIDSTITKTSLSYWSLFTAWPVLLWCSIALGLIWYTFHVPTSALANLTKEETWIASWYLINGFFFNSMMDVFAGQFQSWSGMTDYYNALEPRYVHSSKYDGVTVLLTSWQEILIQTPCGLLLFYAYWRNKSWRYPLELIFNGWSVAGVWYFYLSEPVLNFPHVHSPFNRETGAFDSNASWTFETIWKFWIGFVILPLIWTVVGIGLTMRSVKICSQHIEISEVSFLHAVPRCCCCSCCWCCCWDVIVGGGGNCWGTIAVL